MFTAQGLTVPFLGVVTIRTRVTYKQYRDR